MTQKQENLLRRLVEHAERSEARNIEYDAKWDELRNKIEVIIPRLLAIFPEAFPELPNDKELR